MATTQDSSSSSSGQSTAEQNSGPLPASGGGGASAAVQSPIGVPYYITDPRTGQPLIGPDGQPVRWGAVIPGTEDDMAARGRAGAPATQQLTGPQYGQYVHPRYFDGDQWLPAQLPPDQLAALQRKMVAAGLLKTGEAQLGVWDVNSMQAYQRLLAYANASGLDAQTALDRWGAAHAADPNAGKAPLTVRTTNPDDLRLAFRAAIIDKLGQGWDQAKIDQMVSAYQGVETSSQTQAYNAQNAAGGTVVAPPSPQAYAAAQAQQENPTGVAEHDIIKSGGVLDSFKQMLGGWH